MGSIAEVTPTDKWNLLQPDEGHFKDKVLANELVSEWTSAKGTTLWIWSISNDPSNVKSFFFFLLGETVDGRILDNSCLLPVIDSQLY